MSSALLLKPTNGNSWLTMGSNIIDAIASNGLHSNAQNIGVGTAGGQYGSYGFTGFAYPSGDYGAALMYHWGGECWLMRRSNNNNTVTRLLDTNALTVETATSESGTLRFVRFGRVCTLNRNTATELTTDGDLIPSRFRPVLDELTFVGKAYYNGADRNDQLFRITTGGRLYARSKDNNTNVSVTWTNLSITYITVAQ